MASQPKTPAEIAWKVKRKRIPPAWLALRETCQLICSTYHNLFGGCLVVDDERLESIAAHLVDAGRTPENLLSAVRAYHRHVTTDLWYREAGRADPRKPAGTSAHKDLASFLNCKRFDEFLESGVAYEFKAQLSALSTQPSALSPAEEAGIYAEFLNAPKHRAIALVDQAEAELQQQRRQINHDNRRNKIVEILRRAGGETQTARISEALKPNTGAK